MISLPDNKSKQPGAMRRAAGTVKALLGKIRKLRGAADPS
jgi:hypothetical protein